MGLNYTGEEEHFISLDDAAALTRRYRLVHTHTRPTLAEYFGKGCLETILGQDGCVGLRIYNGLSPGLTSRLVIVGVTSDGNDIVNGYIAELGRTCPPECPADNPLNS